ncbi:MAG: hypothetical protein KC417_10140, partial [Myxococcales bacterium]|nr:hypothetical protein [Myxococcales bacterium]
GGIKPCVSANVGDQFGKGNWHLVERVYQAFYFIINFGSFFSTLLVPWLKEHYGASVAFAVPGILMGVATLFFWLGREKFVHVPAKPGGVLGALDTLSGTLMFFTIGAPMFFGAFFPAFAALAWFVKLAISVAFLAAGFAVFALRQRMQPDDGFLAVLFYALKVRFTGREEAPLAVAFVDGSAGAPGVGAAVAADTEGLASHWFYGPAVRRFGVEAAEGPWAVLRIALVFAMVTVFWSLFDQHGSSWIRQAELMDRHFDIFGWKFEMLASQVAAMNPVLVMMLVPLFGFGLYPGVEKLTGWKMTPLRRMSIGMFVASTAFVCVALIQIALEGDPTHPVHVAWQFVPFLLITVAEVMVSVTGLEFAYTQAPRRMKSTVMGFWLLTVSFGNELVAVLARFEGLPLVTFFWLFAGLMAAAAAIFSVISAFYRYRDYTQ